MMQSRPPIVVIMGHVDHGKTSLLDALRQTDVAAGEVGGITQSVRAFQLSSPPATFIDTPGHEAFSAMRSRGGQLADLAILVVAGNDGVKPQTKESIAHIQKSGLPTIVAVTKADLPEFNLDKVKNQLVENGVLVEGLGGDIPVIPVSVKTKTGLTELVEMVGLVNDLHPTQADPAGELAAVVLESRLDVKKGPTAVVVVKNGTLALDQTLFAGQNPCGKAKALTGTSGEAVKTAGPATPVEILGLTEVVPVGAVVSSRPISAVAIPVSDKATEVQAKLKIILKADVIGSLEAIQAALPAEVAVVLAATGDISESDILLAQSTGAKLIGFNVKASGSVAKLAEVDKLPIYNFRIIYELLDKVTELLNPQPTEKIIGQAQVLAEFNISGQHVAGCKCTQGKFARGNQVKVGDKQARVKSLRMGKTEVAEVKTGQEFGMILAPAIDFKVGDDIISIENYIRYG